MRTRTDSIIAAITHGIVMFMALAPLTVAASDTMQGTLQEYIIDYPAENGESEAPEHAGVAAQGETPQFGRTERKYRLQRDDGSDVILQGEDALEGYSTGDRVSVQGRVVSAAGAEGPERMAVQTVESADQTGETRTREEGAERQSRAADHGSGSVEQRRVLGIVVDFEGSETGISQDDARNAIRASNTSSDALFRIGSGGDANGGGQLGFFPPEGSGPAVTHVDVDITPDGCDFWKDVDPWADAADEAARNQGIDFSNHQHTVYFLPEGATSCRWAGLGGVGCGDGCRAWVIGTGNGTTAHELGHNVGLNHTRKFQGEGEELKEYGEYTLMGWHYGFINPPQREFLGWYDDHPDRIRSVEGGEKTVTIAGLSADYDGSRPHTVKVPVDDGDRAYYAYLADEDPLGKNGFGPVSRNSVIITRSDAGNSYTTQYDELGTGDEYRDEDRGVRFTVDSKSSSEATLRVQKGDELVAEDTAWTMAPGQTHEGTLEASQPGDTEPSFQKANGADQGQASVESDGSFTYTANDDAEGSDTFTFQASTDDQAAEGEAEVSFNQTPQVEPLELTVDAGASVEDKLSASDAESAIEDLALTITESPQKGTIEGPKDDGSFTYTAEDDSSGTDTFRYTAGDAYSESEPAEVTVTIEGDDGDGSGGGDDSGGSGGGSIGATGAPWLLLLGLLALVAGRGRRLEARC